MTTATEQPRETVEIPIPPHVVLAVYDDMIAALEARLGQVKVARRVAELAMAGQLPLELGAGLEATAPEPTEVESVPVAEALDEIVGQAAKARAPRRSTSSRRGQHMLASAEKSRDRVLAHVQSHPGASGKEIGAAVGLGKSAVSKHLTTLVEAGQIVMERDGAAKRYAPADGSAAPAKSLGPARTGAADRVDRTAAASKATQQRDDIRTAIANSGSKGLTAAEVAEIAGVSVVAARNKLRELASKGLVAVDNRDDIPLYRDHTQGMAPPDDDGCKTEHERKLLAAVKAAPVALTASEVARNAGVNSPATGAVLSGLARRGVLRRIDPVSMDAPARWEVAA